MVNYLTLLFFVINYSCAPIVHNRNDFNFKEGQIIDGIQTNGYYYAYNFSKNQDSKSITVRILFKNGLYKQIGVVSSESDSDYFKKRCNNIQNNTYESSFENIECMIDNYDYFFKVKTNFVNKNAEIWDWGGFEIRGDRIKIQYFYNRFGDYYLIEEEGRVIDSQSFKMVSKYDYRNGIKEDLNITYFFKKYDVNNVLNYKPKKNTYTLSTKP
jgi:hypothetical protein